MKTMYYLIPLAFALILHNCTSYPISKKYREEAISNVNFTQIQKNPLQYMGSIVIWGGSIIQTINDSSISKLIILEIPLNENGQPLSPERSRGRFIAVSDTFLDPEIYYPKRKLTMAGVISGQEKMAIGNLMYSYPVVSIKELSFWSKQYYYPGFYPYFMPGYWFFYW